MKIYIASSWRNQHGVEMLTGAIRDMGHTVISWIENNQADPTFRQAEIRDPEAWVETQSADESFEFDTNGATKCDLFIYYAPAGMDAAAELGAAWASRRITWGLRAKGDNLGLMRKMVDVWFDDCSTLIKAIFQAGKIK